MSKRVVIKDGEITAEISTFGAELKSLKVSGKEYIWQGDERYWSGSSPILFPICSGLKDDEYILNNKTYNLEKHGFARDKEFVLESAEGNTAVFSLCADEDTLKSYPFDFKLTVTFKLSDNKLEVNYTVENLSNERMYFSIGAHEAYACPGGIENYEVVLPEKETLVASVLEGAIIGDETNVILENESVLKLKNEYFDIDALIFKSMKARSVLLREISGDREIKVDFDGFDYFLIWTIPGAEYICLEPWCGISDSVNTNKDFTTKEGIQSILPSEKFVRNHIVHIIK